MPVLDVTYFSRCGVDSHILVVWKVLQPGDKIIPVFGVEEDFPSFNSSAHDMMEHPRGI
jgi:hypothetical protein